MRFKLAPGQEGDVVQAPAMIEGFKARAVLADTAYDSRAFREAIEATGAKPDRPVQDETFRAVIMASLAAVDLVVEFSEDRRSHS